MTDHIFKLKRIVSDDKGTVSLLQYNPYAENGTFMCFAIEDPKQNVKVPGKTRIPAGLYKMRRIAHTPLCARHRTKYGIPWLPEIMDVPGFTDIRMHVGNMPEETEGCPLLNERASLYTQVQGARSAAAMSRFIEFCDSRCSEGQMWLHVIDQD